MTFTDYLLERFEELSRGGRISVVWDSHREEATIVCRHCGKLFEMRDGEKAQRTLNAYNLEEVKVRVFSEYLESLNAGHDCPEAEENFELDGHFYAGYSISRGTLKLIDLGEGYLTLLEHIWDREKENLPGEVKMKLLKRIKSLEGAIDYSEHMGRSYVGHEHIEKAKETIEEILPDDLYIGTCPGDGAHFMVQAADREAAEKYGLY